MSKFSLDKKLEEGMAIMQSRVASMATIGAKKKIQEDDDDDDPCQPSLTPHMIPRGHCL